VRAAVEELRAAGRTVVGASLLGGTEKLASETPDFGLAGCASGPTPLAALQAGLDRFGPDEVVDLSDEPVLDARTRMLLAAHSLVRGVPYRGAGFAFEVPPRPRVATKPSVAVIGTGKRTGKTAVAAEVARCLAGDGLAPVMVAMGRGGPEEPELVDPAVFALSSWPTPGPSPCWSSRGRGRPCLPFTPTPPSAWSAPVPTRS
jgi:cyclic 2,3-diphosphoglycerate synthetase